MSSTRAAAYLRLSDPNAPDAPTLDAQEALARTYCQEKGYEVVAVFREAYTGATLRDRPQMRELLTVLEQRAFDVVVVRDVDRLARNIAAVFVFKEHAERYGARLEFVLETFEETAIGKFMLSAKAFAAEYEREKIAWRTMTGRRRRVESGKLHNHGAERYGYRRDKEAGVRLLYEPEASIVRLIYQWVDEEGLGIRQVQKRLHQQGIPAPGVEKWTFKDGRTPVWGYTTVRKMLRDPAYKGETITWKWKNLGRHRNAQQRPESEQIRLPEGVTPPIVSAEVWQRVQDRLDANRGERTRNEQRPALLRGRIRCLACGRPMWPDQTPYGAVYRCSSRATVVGACDGKRVPLEPVEAWVWQRVARVLKDPERILAERPQNKRYPSSAAGDTEQRLLHSQVERLTRQQRRYLQLYAEADDAGISLQQVKGELARVAVELAAAQDRLRQLEVQAIATRAQQSDTADVQAYLLELSGAVEKLAFEGRRSVLEWLRVVVYASGRQWEIDARVYLGRPHRE